MEYLVIDTESCTGRADDGSLCSIGYAVCDENLNVIKHEDLLINPLPKRFMIGDKKNFKRTGIEFAYAIDEFRKAPRFNIVYPKIAQLFKGRTVLGFSMSNDVKYLNDACDKFELPRIEYKYYDIQYVYQLLHPEETSVGLKTLNEKYQIEYLAHRSDEDAIGSVLLLKKFLDSDELTFTEVIKKYKIHKGVNLADGYYPCFAEAVIDGAYGLKISKRIQGIILSNYLKNLPYLSAPFEKVCFSHKIEKMEVNFVRTLIDLCIEQNFSYDRDTDVVTVFVTDDKEDKKLAHLTPKQKDKIKIYTLKEFCSKIGYQEDFIYSDKNFLISYFKRLTK